MCFLQVQRQGNIAVHHMRQGCHSACMEELQASAAVLCDQVTSRSSCSVHHCRQYCQLAALSCKGRQHGQLAALSCKGRQHAVIGCNKASENTAFYKLLT